MADWSDRIAEPAQKQLFAAKLREYRGRRQGYAAVAMRLRGDSEFVTQRGIAEAAHAVAMLRFVAPEAQLPGARSYMAPVNLMPAPEFDVWLFKNEEPPAGSHSVGLHLPRPISLTLDDHTLAELRHSAAFEDLSHLAAGANLTQYEGVLQEAILLHSKATATASPSEKLAFVMVALETLLLRDSSEPIQQAVADRFALLLVRDPSDRRDLARLFRATYGLRSRFVHHGRDPQDLSTLAEFLRMTWVLLLQLLRNRKLFGTKDALLDHAEALKYS